MAPRRVGILALAILGLSAGLSVYAATHAPAPKAATVAGQLALDAPLPTRVPPGVTLAIGDPTTEQVLKHTGWIRQLPFQVKWAEITGGPAVTEAFHAGVLDVGTVANIPPIHAIWVGIPVRMIAVRFRRDPADHPSFELAIAPKARINSLKDLRGKRIAYSPGQVQGEIVQRVLQSQGLTAKDVTLVELPSPSADIYVNALSGGLIDVAPIGAGAALKRYVDRFGPDGAKVLKSGVRDDFVTMYVPEATLKDPGKAAALRAYVGVWGRAQAWINSHPDEWAQVYYVANQGLSPEDARYVVRANGEAELPRDWTEAIERQQGSVNLMAQATGRKPFNAERLFDRRFETLSADAFAEAGGGGPALASR
ncbi:MAG TPA: ABC transporter substrate-binding protein [Phenylobacterium sp.]|nr:ABC transporter substrate-binding protein [Phenylobacterium sp.]